MQRFLLFFCLLVCFVINSCSDASTSRQNASSEIKPTTIRYDGQTYQLLRYGKPYFIQGAGGISYLNQLKACGGNSIRIWDDLEAGPILKQAHTLGLTVLFGLWVEREMEGFDYDDQSAVDRQYERIRKIVLKYRSQPALLMWCVGNEWAQAADNFKVFDEVNRIAKLVHELDPDHPVTTVISPDNERAVWLVRQRCPAIDILAVNSYKLTENLGEIFKKGGWDKPYLISEYGAQAYWETPTTPWEAPVEPTSLQKDQYVTRIYRKYIGSRPPNCLGSYLFYWGYKQEETQTWFSVFDEQGRSSPLVDLVQLLWTGKKPANQAPIVQSLLIDGQNITHKSFTNSPSLHRAQLVTTDPEHDSLTYHWEIKRRAQHSADYVGTPLPALKGLIQETSGASITFNLPRQPGSYRLFAYAYDTHRHVATANFAFQVAEVESDD
jgi:hypothetical protein